VQFFFQVLRFITLGNHMEDDPLVCRFIMDLNCIDAVTSRLLKHYGWEVMKCNCSSNDCFCYKRSGVSRFGEMIKVGELLPNRKINLNYNCKYSRHVIETSDHSALESYMVDSGSSFHRVSATGYAEVKNGKFNFVCFEEK